MINQNSGNLSDKINNGEDNRSDSTPEIPEQGITIDSDSRTVVENNGADSSNADNEIASDGEAVSSNEEKHICKNCENEFTGHFCNNCGQSAKDFDRPVSVLIVDAMANMVAFDTRVWKSLKSILFKPGEMALDYISGKRVRYMPPFRLYLFISFIFFLLLRLSVNSDSNIKLISVQDKEEGVKTEKSIDVVPESVASTDLKTNDLKPREVKTDKLKKSKNTKNTKKIEDIKANKELYISRFFTYLSWALILMMPLYAMLLWFLFRKYQRHYLGHFIFSLNQHAFLFFIFSIQIIITLIFPAKETIYEAWLLLAFPVYQIIGARKLYRAKWSSVVLKMGLAFFVYQMIVLSSIVLLLYIIFYNLN